MTNARYIEQVRVAIIQSLPIETSQHGDASDPRHVYVPPSHIKALRLESDLVIGARGVGKSFWSAALQSERVRNMLGGFVDESPKTSASMGFGDRIDIESYPDSETFASLIDRGVDPYHIWRGVLARWAARIVGEVVPKRSWVDTVDWVRKSPENFTRLLQQANAFFDGRGEFGLIIFDALDRSSQDWETMDTIIRDLLRIMLMLKPFGRLHGKVFLREDQFEKRRVTDFPDASKLLATRVELTWGLNDLHGLLWQYLVNGPDEHGLALRKIFERETRQEVSSREDDLWVLPERAKRDEVMQRKLFSALAGESMGRDRRRGVPYTWSVGHLADGRGRTSPRSFLAAIRAAAEDSLDRYPDFTDPLHYESIKRGVQRASEIRVEELAEDYPWVRALLEPLSGQVVPCPFQEIEDRWEGSMKRLHRQLKSERLSPEHIEDGVEGFRQDLENLGIFESMRDGRVNMPDLYRVGFGLGRRGGVKPVART